MTKKKLIGEVVSVKMQKTVVVEVERIKEHKKYKRRFKVHKKYKAHVENDGYIVGDKVLIEECRPISKDKKWKVIEKIAVTKKKEEAIPLEEKNINEEIKDSA
jgi:small subunit ribosomal protein S17